jgi:hypothetical protein
MGIMPIKQLAVWFAALLILSGCDLMASQDADTAIPATPLPTVTPPPSTPTSVAHPIDTIEVSTATPSPYVMPPTPTRNIPALKCGLTWTVVDINVQGGLSAVEAVSSKDVWAVGSGLWCQALTWATRRIGFTG